MSTILYMFWDGFSEAGAETLVGEWVRVIIITANRQRIELERGPRVETK